AVIASFGIKPNASSWVNLIGWYSPEATGVKVDGGSILAGYQITPKLGTGFEGDYFNFHTAGPDADIWSLGGWASYDFTPKLGLALRADYLGDPDGVPGPAVRPGAAIVSPDTHGHVGSVTLTLNYKPVSNIKIQPEIRYDYTSYSGVGGAKGALDGHKSRFIL